MLPAKKHFGQHFLTDTGALDRIVRYLNPSPDDLVLEIGAGEGTLSSRLAPRVGALLAIEIDRDRIPPLRAALTPFPSAVVVQGDILNLDLVRLVEPYRNARTVRVAGNLPYNIATAIIERVLEASLSASD